MTPMRHPADGRIHFSELKQHAKSPAHVRLACERARDMTRPMVVGSITDDMVFSGGRNVALYPGKVRNGKEWEAFKAANPGKTLCIQSELDDAMGAAEAVLRDPVAARYLDGCEFQRVMQWEAYGLQCAAGIAGERGGFDALHTGKEYIADLKITSDTEPDALSRHAWNMLWHVQGAWYLDGARALAIRARRFVLICAEANPPHNVTVLEVPDALIENGRKSLTHWTERHRACEAAGTWPGYVQAPVEMAIPEWMDQ